MAANSKNDSWFERFWSIPVEGLSEKLTNAGWRVGRGKTSEFESDGQGVIDQRKLEEDSWR